MDEQDKNKHLELSPEEQNAEVEATKEVSEDELATKIATDMGLDPDTDAELLAKIVAREKDHRTKLSSAIKQKRTWREKATTSSTPVSKTDVKPEVPNIDELVEKKLNERLEARDLESLDIPEEIKDELKDYAKYKGISVKEAVKSDYITAKIEKVERETRINRASPKRSAGGKTSVDLHQPLDPSNYDLNTEEGRKAWAEDKAERAKRRSG